MPGGEEPKNMKIYVCGCFLVVWSSPKAPRGMPEAVTVDPESISPREGMATPFSPDLVFSGPRFGLAEALEPEAEKSILA